MIGSGKYPETIYEIVNRDLISDTVIEVIDLHTGQLVAQRRFDRLYPALLPNGLVAAEASESGGFDLLGNL